MMQAKGPIVVNMKGDLWFGLEEFSTQGLDVYDFDPSIEGEFLHYLSICIRVCLCLGRCCFLSFYPYLSIYLYLYVSIYLVLSINLSICVCLNP